VAAPRPAGGPCSSWPACATATPTPRLAHGFEIGVSTAWRHVREAIDLLADDLDTVMGRFRRLAYAILDGPLIPTDRVADQKPCYSGKDKRHGVNVQVIADPAGRLIWASAVLPGSTHDRTAARIRARGESANATSKPGRF
jgi:hypothetical protein